MTAVGRPERLYQAVIEQILERIQADRLQPGHPLPTERDLAASLGVSRNVLREAFRVLEERGLIVTRQGAGRYVRKFPPRAGTAGADRAQLERASIADVLEARLLVEEQAIVLACKRRTTPEIERITRLADRLDTWDDNVEFHVAVAEATHNFMLERLVRESLSVLGELRQREHYASPTAAGDLLADHASLAAAIAERDAEGARDLLRRHLVHTRVSVAGGAGDEPALSAAGAAPWWAA